ncbi:MAG TPA: hypothetical protein VGG28_20925 [Kofleriaceae bacterium]|jgi:hypothetical protein
MQQFKVFRAIGIAFSAWFKNFVPITVLAAILYAPAIILATMLKGNDEVITQSQLDGFQHILWLVIAASSLVAPFLTYRIVQYMNGTSSSIMTSISYGFRGIIPVIIVAVVVNVLQMIPIGGIIGAVVQCVWFVAGPAAVAERLNPVAALGRSAALTKGRRWGIFGLLFMIGLGLVIVMIALFAPLIAKGGHGSDFKHMVMVIVPTFCGFQLFVGIVQAVSYSLLRADKDGVTHEELAKVFE